MTQHAPDPNQQALTTLKGCGGCLLACVALAVTIGLWSSFAPKPAPSRTGNPAVYARIDALTDCAELQQMFDTAYENHGAEIKRGRLDWAKMCTDYMEAADSRMKAIGCSGAR